MSRIEHDLLGSKELPDNAYYGIHTLRALENFKISGLKINAYKEFIKALALVKKATAAANRDLGKLSKEKSVAITAACDKIINDYEFYDQFCIDPIQGGAGTSVNMNANEVIANVALEIIGKQKGEYSFIHPNDDVNMSQSTNDAYPTALRLAIYEASLRIFNKLEYAKNGFNKKAQEFSKIIKMGRTQLQDAVPMTLGQEFSAYSVLMDEEKNHLITLSRLLLETNLGATAIGTGVNAPDGFANLATKYLAEFSGHPVSLSDNLIEATSDSGAYTSISAALRRIAVKLSKISNDLRLLSSGPRTGFNEINLPEMQAGSSIMPGKVNPVIPEVINQISFKVIGNDLTVTLASEAAQLELNAMEPIIAQSIFESINLLDNGFDTLIEKCVNGITANKEVCSQYVHNSIGIVTYLNPLLGHEKCDEIAKECLKTGKTVKEVVLENNYLTEAEVDTALAGYKHDLFER